MVAQEQGSTARQSSTEHAVKVGKGQRAAGKAKAAGAVRVGGQRVAGVKGTESEIDKNLVGQEFGRHNKSRKCPDNPRARPPKRTYGTPGTQRSQMTC